MLFKLPYGAPTYCEIVGKTSAVADIRSRELPKPGDHLVDPRDNVWAIDYIGRTDDPSWVRLTLFCPTRAATLSECEELRPHKVEPRRCPWCLW